MFWYFFKFLSKGIGIYGVLLYVNNVILVFYIFVCILSLSILTLTSFKPHKILFDIINITNLNPLYNVINIRELFVLTSIILLTVIFVLYYYPVLYLLNSFSFHIFNSSYYTVPTLVFFTGLNLLNKLTTFVNTAKWQSLFNPLL